MFSIDDEDNPCPVRHTNEENGRETRERTTVTRGQRFVLLPLLLFSALLMHIIPFDVQNLTSTLMHTHIMHSITLNSAVSPVLREMENTIYLYIFALGLRSCLSYVSTLSVLS